MEDIQRQLQNVTMIDMRGYHEEFSLYRNGFQVVDHQSALKGQDFDDDELVQDVYYKEAEACVTQVINRPMETYVLNHQVTTLPDLRSVNQAKLSQRRRRDPEFPAGPVRDSQPLRLAHCGT